MTSFSDFLDNCGSSVNHSQQTIVDSYRNWKLTFEMLRSGSVDLSNRNLSKPVLKGLDTYKLSDEEAFFILSYTAQFSSWINNPLRRKASLDKCQQEFASRLDFALTKMPRCKIDFLYRMDTPDCEKDEELGWFTKNIGRVIKVPAFLSVAKSNWDNATVTWKIAVTEEFSLAIDLAELRNNPSEDEALYVRGSLFKILGLDGDMVLLEETVETSDPIIELSGNYAGCS